MNALHAEALVMNEEFDSQLAAQFEADHEMALLMNDKFDRDREEQRRLAEQAQREHEERIKRKRQNKPAAMPKRSTKQRLKPQRAVKLKKKLALSWLNASASKRNSVQLARSRKRKSVHDAKKKRPLPLSAAARKRQRPPVWPKSSAKLKKKRRAADKEHRRTVNRRVYEDLIAQGIPEEFAQKAVLAIAGGKVQDAHIKY
jgi:hypothetical protein